MVEGLTIDTDQRWSLLGRLVAAGRAGDAAMAGQAFAELTREADKVLAAWQEMTKERQGLSD